MWECNVACILIINLVYVSDNWMDNNAAGSRGGREPDNWGGRGGGRDLEKWGGRGIGRDPDGGWGGRGNRLSSWRGNGNRRRNEDWEGPNQQKRWRRDDNPEWDDQQKQPWKRVSLNEEEEWQKNNKGPSQWASGKNDEGNFSKFKNRDNNEERPRKPSKWGDRESDDKVKEDHLSKKTIENNTSSKDKSNETNTEVSHQTSAPMDLVNCEDESTENAVQQHEVCEQKVSNLNQNLEQNQKFENERCPEGVVLQQEHFAMSNFNTKIHDQGKDDLKHDDQQHNNNEHQQFGKYQNDTSNNLQEQLHDNVKETQHLETHFKDNFEQQNVEGKQHDNNYQNDNSYNDSQLKYETIQNDRKFEQNHLVEPEYNNPIYENKLSNYDQFNSDVVLQNSNQEHSSSVDNFVPQENETNSERCIEEQPGKSQNSFYFGTDANDYDSSVNKPIEIIQSNSEIMFPNEETEMTLPPNSNEVHKVISDEPNSN